MNIPGFAAIIWPISLATNAWNAGVCSGTQYTVGLTVPSTQTVIPFHASKPNPVSRKSSNLTLYKALTVDAGTWDKSWKIMFFINRYLEF